MFQSYGQPTNNAEQLDSLTQTPSQEISAPIANVDLDSSVQKFISSINGFKISSNPLDDVKGNLNSDSLLRAKHLIPGTSGLLSAGFEHGLLTGYVDQNSTAPLSVFNTNGDFSIEAVGLPVNFSYNYSTFKNPLGVNNYFRFSLDTDKLKQNAASKKNQAIGSIDKSINDLQSNKGIIQSKMGMGEVLLQKYKRQITQSEQQMGSLDGKIKDKTADVSQLPNDTTGQNLKDRKELDSLKQMHDKAQSNYQKAIQLYDTINKVYQKALTIYNKYSSWQSKLNEKKSSFDSYSSLASKDVLSDKAMDKKDGFVSSIKTLDLGLAYPKTTGLSNNSIPIQGLNFEMQKEKWYLALSSGVTMNNLMVSTDAVQNKLNNSQNLFNQFDFQNIKERGWLTNVKTGYGTLEGSHALIGFRYLTNSIPLSGNSDDTTTIPSLGAELDFRWVPTFSKGTKLDFIYGKTSYREAIQDSSRSNTINSLFSSDPTNTALLSITQNFSKIRTNVLSSVRWIDPYADVKSLGVLQPDNFRYEARTSTSVTQGLRIGLNYRFDKNNVWSLKDSTIRLNVIGGQLNGNFGKAFTYFTSLNYLTQTTESSFSSSRKNNYMFGIGISTNYSIGHLKNAVSFSYNDYLITDSVSTGLFRNISLQHITKLDKGINKFSAGYFQMMDDVQPDNTSLIIGDEYSFQKNKLRLTLGIKIANSDNYGTDMGGKIETSYRIIKNLEWTLKAEKLVLGDFYNYYSRDRFDRFPLAITTRLNFILN